MAAKPRAASFQGLRRQLIELLTARASATAGVQVVIGSEMPYQEMHETSLVAAAYKYGDQVLGVLGVVGPRRMPYAKVVPLVDYTARLVPQHPLTSIPLEASWILW